MGIASTTAYVTARCTVDERVTVAEAAQRLGISKDAVRQRIRRDTIEYERDDEGRILVVLSPETTAHDPVHDDEHSGVVGAPLLQAKDETIALLRQQLEAEREANRENRRLLAAALERMPAIEAPPDTARQSTPEASRSARGSPVSDEEGPPYGTAPQDAEESLHHVPYGETSPGWRGATEPSRVPWWRRLFGG